MKNIDDVVIEEVKEETFDELQQEADMSTVQSVLEVDRVTMATAASFKEAKDDKGAAADGVASAAEGKMSEEDSAPY